MAGREDWRHQLASVCHELMDREMEKSPNCEFSRYVIAFQVLHSGPPQELTFSGAVVVLIQHAHSYARLKRATFCKPKPCNHFGRLTQVETPAHITLSPRELWICGSRFSYPWTCFSLQVQGTKDSCKDATLNLFNQKHSSGCSDEHCHTIIETLLIYEDNLSGLKPLVSIQGSHSK